MHIKMAYASFLAWFYSSPLNAGPARQLPDNLSSGKLNKESVPSSAIIVTQKVLDNVKLNHVTTRPPKKYFPPRSPVLQEILDRRYHKENRKIVCNSIHNYWNSKVIIMEDEEDDW